MYLITYRMALGESRHYAPSSRAGARFVRDIEASGGSILGISRTRDGEVMTLPQLEAESLQQIDPGNPRGTPLVDRLRRLIGRSRI
jgi:hypothetical protein